MSDVLIIGAGISGLAAAETMASEGKSVTLLEARERTGGRINTAGSRIGNLPIELGAEFVHGAKNATWEMIRAAGLETQEVPGRHWQWEQGRLREDNRAWDELEKVFSKIDIRAPDQDFISFLLHSGDMSEGAKAFALEYVEGFHAADPRRVSIHSLAKAETAAQADEGERQFRITRGYAALVNWLANRLAHLGVQLRLGTVAETIAWEPGSVQVEGRTRSGRELYRAPQLLVTVPLGVLQAQGLGGLVFAPRIAAKDRAIQGLAMGSVVRITFHFRARFWPVDNFGFIHAQGKPFPTWWSDERGLLLTAWAGGPQASSLGKNGADTVQARAIEVLANVFGTSAREVQELVLESCHHDWDRDPLARGAYSYTPSGAGSLIAELAAPVRNTLFFAGEATDGQGEQGTVHGALASGRRAAQEMLAVKSEAHRPTAKAR